MTEPMIEQIDLGVADGNSLFVQETEEENQVFEAFRVRTLDSLLPRFTALK